MSYWLRNMTYKKLNFYKNLKEKRPTSIYNYILIDNYYLKGSNAIRLLFFQ